MRFAEAFKALGYELEAVRTDWSAEADHGVCLSLWKKETDFRALVMDTRVHADPIEGWGHKPGNKRRIAHADRALREFDGWIDVVALDGVPGEGYGNASPWDAKARGRRWRITFLDPKTGHLRLEAQETKVE
ncbi:hypothetical protein GON01_05600 [Sphingomonas sp. MAH-20]|uniref:Uncharacterized protein n=1 Tax=Sphingomonas horti TaxID=2682842 RepID=A0A6I4J006_9SPHN|nr:MULTISPECIES: hypothetical protein [Sphingomonas]MBA2918446.1 hypothetical protein [Sphingomonas sp. CGMCC 1.13658]MVO77413.1 hypothetical protein [Sphingomonas horti]